MSYCPKCGNKIRDDMSFCPKCGASLKVEGTQQPPQPTQPPVRLSSEKQEKYEKREKQERSEKGEKAEKREKGEYPFIGPLIGGIILIVIGALAYLQITTSLPQGVIWAVFFVLIGIIIIIGVVYGIAMTSRRHPKT